ncbi:FkbM family methyltransferase [Longimicrobium terrae]|uniref:FkbM family methyltransferase n=1 Tax=Longimicrobium terrae TaxID=1639882 RepID=A0A841GQU6_9BACT|nr:FkbM family methyltransferase [Longimicrobium terrae]MBB4634531.1 FkbM family methyltransferase [Longimicrobium terrae]MBB6068579.1 FkbM family methyltransferase [Longimicrobium terrae]NNC27766.1 FkbM family methyltransferase [Longimicrobium terrae]
MTMQGLSVLRDSLRIARQARSLAAAPPSPIPGREVARNYTRLKLKQSMHTRMGRSVSSPEQVMGYQVHYADFDTLVCLFEELYVDEDYFARLDVQGRPPVIVDCGSNIGMSILYFKTLYPNAVIVGFEPFREAYDLLRANVEANGLRDVTVHCKAVGANDAGVDLFFDPDKTGSLRMSTVPERIAGGVRPVESVALSTYLPERVDLLKMDIEGAEHDVVEELEQSGALARIGAMAIEYHHHIRPDEDRLSDMLGILERAGFGYQLWGKLPRGRRNRDFQDLHIFAYRKTAAPK